MMIGDEISKQNQMLEELDFAVDLTTNTIQQDRETLQRNQKKSTSHHCGMYLCCIILILFVIISGFVASEIAVCFDMTPFL